MEAELKKQTKKPSRGYGDTKVDLKDMSQEVPKVKDLLSEIDDLLEQTNPEKNNCWC